jgi:hypothetical protein
MPAAHPELTPERSLVARFADRVQVTGFDLPRDVTAGQTLAVRWYWTILAREPRELTFFNQVVGAGNEKHGSIDWRAFAPNYWPAGTTGVSTFQVPVDEATTTGAYNLVVGLYDRDSLARLPIYDTQGRPAGDQLVLGPIKVHGRPAPQPVASHPQPASWGDGVELKGYDLPSSRVAAGQKLGVTFYWSARSRPTADYTVFVHLVDQNRRVVAQADAPPQAGRYPTSVWDGGDTIVDPHELSVDQNVASGTYALEIGWYQPDSGQRLPLLDGSGHPIGESLLLVGFTVG